MIFYPKMYLKNVKEIEYNDLEKNNIKAIILDVDNTLIDYYKKLLDGVDIWCNNLKQKGIKFCILSNSNKKEKIENVAKKLEIPYINFAKKPFKSGFKKASEILKVPNENIAVVGDQIFTDIIGANRCKMFSILVEPIEKKDIWITVLKRPIEKAILKNYINAKEKKEEKNDIL